MARFHKMEIDYNLYNIGADISYPVWDMLRVHIYNNYLVQSAASNHCISYILIFSKVINRILFTIISFCDFLQFPFMKGRILFYEHTNDKEGDYYYDHIAKQLIESIPSSHRVVINSLSRRPTFFNEKSLIFYKFVTNFFFSCKDMAYGDFDKIRIAILDTFDVNLSYKDVNRIYREKKKDYYLYKKLLRLLKPRRLIVSFDCQKPMLLAAKELFIETYEMQHAGLVFEYPSYSYPIEVDASWNLIFADYYLQFGSAWSSINNIPTRRVTIGNDYFLHYVFERPFNEKYILVISSIENSSYLKPFVQDMSIMLPDLVFIYKLHPNEFNFKSNYESDFINYHNVKVVSNEYNLQSLIAFCEMSILVYSSVCFELLNRKKKVVILKKGNYLLIVDVVKNNPLVMFTKEVEEAISFMDAREDDVVDCDFYSAFNIVVAKQLAS